jgi:hypothetical protein
MRTATPQSRLAIKQGRQGLQSPDCHKWFVAVGQGRAKTLIQHPLGNRAIDVVRQSEQHLLRLVGTTAIDLNLLSKQRVIPIPDFPK